MEITRTFDIETINQIVYEAFGEKRDMAKWLSCPDNYALLGEHGAMLFGMSKPRSYSVTSAVKPVGAGKWAVDFGKATTEWMFANTDAKRLWATVAPENKRALVTMKAALNAKVEQSGPFRIASITRTRWSNQRDKMAG